MSTITLGDLKHTTREELAKRLLSSSSSNPQTTSTSTSTTSSSTSQENSTPTSNPDLENLAIIDVRDSDHIGGHILGSRWVPSSSLDAKIPELVRELQDKETVVFHCALSQQRGPSAALRYLRERERLINGSEGEAVREGGDTDEGEKEVEGRKGRKKQEVVVLDGGFVKWQEVYGEDERLTEGWRKDVWEFGY
ncbi:Rhodanese-like protein [Sporormia fimetaria CBS 119925]|uniref:Rhodanese-like protein n=1 Tax=Sporormia fimetaria CBS 119925 TaxID=1340428 RepID=A0A6A6VDI3_9PLEO|nr:Rhodanese-like protein [Sporormia fimetaria CBS 119925]